MLERDTNTECRTAGKHLNELFSAYRHQFKVKAADFFRAHKGVDTFFSQITPRQAFQIPKWQEYVNTSYETHNKQLQLITDALDNLTQNSKQSYKELVIKQEQEQEGRIKNTEWSLNCPTPTDLESATGLVLAAMQANIPLALNRHQIDEEIQQIASTELSGWDSVLRSIKRLAQDLMHVQPIHSTYDQVEQTRRLILDELERFALLRKCTTKSEAEQCLVDELNRLNSSNQDPDQALRDVELMNQYHQTYQLWLTKQQEHTWNSLMTEHELELERLFTHLRAMRKQQLTKVSAQALNELEASNQARLQSLRANPPQGLEELTAKLKELEQQSNERLKEEDSQNRVKELYTRLLQSIRESKAGFIRGDPWLENTKQALDAFERKTAQDLGRDFCFCYLLNHDKLLEIHSQFSAETRRLAQQITQKTEAHRAAVEKCKGDIKRHMEQLRITGGMFELISEHTMAGRIPMVPHAKVPHVWLKRYVAALELESFAMQRLFDRRGQEPSKRARSESKEPVLQVSEEIAKDCQASLYNKIIEVHSSNGRDRIEFWPLLDFAQRLHLLLLRVS